MGTPKAFLLGLLLLVLWASCGEAASLKYKDPKQTIGVRIRDLVKRMTLAEKIGQMTQVDRTVATPKCLRCFQMCYRDHLRPPSCDRTLCRRWMQLFLRGCQELKDKVWRLWIHWQAC